ncbi:Fic family protein [Subsaximicrobium wynnwilliamsii]|uniref:Fic family protein n=1 Tax=Subsaximicrobium wynnwilliamsii TaxID=291179 RepID=A0A5C6ZGE5_9FLAO|nr:Fic family protein [Subsaximicrobium wynnwilliamsii]TXD83395.1 Fic family protein [Subsaximicrobium wynnwilliamsii]TXD89158.1 Fic family protein [Subsaximicrobium wynnwilliamsii]TXE03420.1 Fic family protein [Subsaximicrobium wynnwilliamsii]
MKPPYEITPEILKCITSISEKVGEINANYLNRPSPKLRKQNKIKTIHASLKIEGNSLTEEQVTALIENKRVIGPEKDILEVLNAIEIYENLGHYNPNNEKSFLKAHQNLMKLLIEASGRYRKQSVGIVKGSKVQHLAPPFKNVSFLMKDLFEYLKDSEEIVLIKSCVFHYEMEFIHPFMDGNGRMGRLWQTLILMQKYPVFEFLPFETMISNDQEKYYSALALSDKAGQSTKFIEYMLNVIDASLNKLLDFNNRTLNEQERLGYFISLNKIEFSRKEYMDVFKNISSSTASRDLKKGLESNLFEKMGEKSKTKYKLIGGKNITIN